MLLVKEVLKPSLRTVDAIMSKFGVGKKDAQKFLSKKFNRKEVIGGAKVAAVGTGLWAASNFMKAKLGVYPVGSGSGTKLKTSNVPLPKPKPKSKGIGTNQGKVNRGGGARLVDKNKVKKEQLTHKEAFRRAFDNGRRTFTWKGKTYNTHQDKPLG